MACECGFSYVEDCPEDAARHEQLHDWYVNGRPLPRPALERSLATFGKIDVVEVDTTHDAGYRRPFAELAAVAQREMPQFPQGYYGSDDESDIDRRAVAVVKGTRAVAMAVTRRDSRSWLLEWNRQELWLASEEADPTPVTVIERLWTAKSVRRTGLATLLVRTIAEARDTSPDRMAWQIPFTPSGRALVRAICPTQVLVEGDLHDLRDTIAGVRERE